MKRKIAAIIILSCTAILYGGYLLGIPLALNNSKFENFAERTIQNMAGYKVDLVNPKIRAGIIPSIIFRAEELNVLNDDNTKAMAIDRPYINIKLIPLLFKNINISKLKADGLYANVIYDKNHNFKLGQYPIKLQNNPKFTLEKLSANLGKYDISLNDEVQNKNIKLIGSYFKIDNYKVNKNISFSTDSQLLIGDKISKLIADVDLDLPLQKVSEDKIKLNVSLKDLDLSEFNEYAKTLTKGKIKNLSGIVNYTSKTKKSHGHKNIKSNISIDKLAVMLDTKDTSIYCDNPLNITSDVNVINDGVKINNFKILSKGIDAMLSGGVYKTGAKFPKLDLKATVNHARGENIIPLFPGDENLNPDFNFRKLKEHTIYGNATGNLDIVGDADYPNLYGNVLLTDVYLVEPIKDAPQNALIKLNFDKHTMKLDAHVLTDPNEYVDVKGSFKLFRERYSDLDIKTTKNINLVKAKKVLMPLREIFKFELGPVPMMDVPAGFGNAAFRISGTKQDPHAWGQINFRNGTASFIEINNMVAKNVAGWVKFDGDDVDFKTTSLNLNGLPVDVNGKCTMKGDLSVDVKGDGQNSQDLLKIVNTSPILKELQHMLSPITSANGKTKVFITVFGHVNRGVQPVFNKDLFAKGWIEFLSNSMTFFPEKVPASNINGIVNFDKNDGSFKIDANLVNSPITANGFIKNNVLTANAYSHKFSAYDGWKIAKLFYGNKIIPIPGLSSINTSFSGHYKGVINIDKFDYSKIVAKGRIYSNYGSKAPILVNNSEFNVKNGHVHVSPIKGTLKNNPFNLQVDVDNIMTDKQAYNGYFSMKKFDLSALNELEIPELPRFNEFGQFKGFVDIASKIKNNNIRVFTQLSDISFVYKPKIMKIKILDGNALYDDDNLNLNRINALAGDMPVFVNGKISGVSTDNPDLNIYCNAKPTQEFFDQFFNAKSVYPIKLKGDAILSSKLSGSINKLNAKTELKLDKNSSIYYMGATIGDLIHGVAIDIDSLSGKDWVKLNSFKYDKIITSQNGRKIPNTQLTASGGIQLLANNNMRFNNFKVKTNTPTDAKIFNIIFKKPFMKQGTFMSNLTVNGEMLNPKILGTFKISGIDIPMVNANVKDVNFNFKPDIINVTGTSSVMNSNISVDAVIKNKLTPPYVINNLKVHCDLLDFNEISNAAHDYDATLYKQHLGVDENAKNINTTDVIVKSGSITADKIKIQELNATDFLAHFSIDSKKILKIKDYILKLAEGSADGNGTYNLQSNKLDFHVNINKFNAQSIAESLFNMKSQFFGTANGKLNIKCTGLNQEDCMKTLSGNGNFIITDGRMPKLGSLEYLLKATNIVTSGITRISINNIIDLITPLKTGEFKSITGKFDLDGTQVNNIEVYSMGKDLSLFLNGSYNLETYIAKMEVYGTLSTNLTSVFGKLKNLSLNTLLNTIPFLKNTELSPEVEAKIDKIPKYPDATISRIFAVLIDGDINGFTYVKSFKWVK